MRYILLVQRNNDWQIANVGLWRSRDAVKRYVASQPEWRVIGLKRNGWNARHEQTNLYGHRYKIRAVRA